MILFLIIDKFSLLSNKINDHLIVGRRNIKNTNWNTYEEELGAKVGLWFGNITTPADIDRELAKVNSAIITSFETACPERRVSGRHIKVPWWNHELKVLRQKADKAFHIAYKSRSPDDWDKHRVARRAFKKALRQSKRET